MSVTGSAPEDAVAVVAVAFARMSPVAAREHLVAVQGEDALGAGQGVRLPGRQLRGEPVEYVLVAVERPDARHLVQYLLALPASSRPTSASVRPPSSTSAGLPGAGVVFE
ncbi:hypothetical protein SALBM311S_04648 [Streptomyces alboniger]